MSDKVAEILNPRISPERVRQIVELLYHREATLSEKTAWRLRNQVQPYAAEFVALAGAKWEGQITCGHNPWLLARLVDELTVQVDAQGREIASWRDRRKPRQMREKFEQIKSGPQPD